MGTNNNAPHLEGDRTLLRLVTAADVDRIVQTCNDPEMQLWTTVPRPYTASHAQDYVDAARTAWNEPLGAKVLTIEDKKRPGLYCGDVNLRPKTDLIADIGFSLHPDARGQGLMKDAIKTMCQWWFDQGGQVVRWAAYVGNVDSLAVAAAAGFTIDPGTRRFATHDHEGQGRECYTGSLHHDDEAKPAQRPNRPPRLVGTDFMMRPWESTDREHLEEFTHPTHFMPASGTPTQDNFHEWVSKRTATMIRGEGIMWAIADAHTNELLGCLQLAGFVKNSAEIGCWIIPSKQRKHIASEVAHLAIDWAFTPCDEGGLGLTRIFSRHVIDNFGSGKALANNGFYVSGINLDGGARNVPEVSTEILMERHAPQIDTTRIVPATVADWRRLRALRIRALAEDPQSFTGTLEQAQARDKGTWQADAKTSGQFIAVLDGTDIGQIKISKDSDKQGVWNVTRMWVDPSARRQGIGIALLEAAEHFAQARGGKQLILSVFKDQNPARALYLDYGYENTSDDISVSQNHGGRELLTLCKTLTVE